MNLQEYPFVIGTAGHIDHGKTAIVKALSGIDCDRLSEEKRRGMTIELGFAPLTLPCGKTISIIDVPGHEKFIRQMVAGAAGVDAVMLVVAADDGVMPQTREHLEILSLLGIRNGLTVINKIDLVDEEMLEMAKDDVFSLIAGTFLESSPILFVSAITGAGMPELKDAIQRIVENSRQRSRDGSFFLPVDRVFHISGFGTVITGTAIKGIISENSDIEILPSRVASKVRSIQVHNEPVQKAYAGQRVAINLTGVSLEDVKRGDVIAAKNSFVPTECINVTVKVLPSFTEPIEHWQRLRLHVGTSDVVARISLLDRENILPGESAIAQLLPEEPITVCRDVPFILRTYSPLRTVAGGRVLLSLGERPKGKTAKTSLIQFLNALSGETDSKDRLLALIEYKEILTETEALTLLELDPRELGSVVASFEANRRIGVLKTGERLFISLTRMEKLKEKLISELDKFHKAHPERKGMDAEEVSRNLSLNDARFVKELMRLFQRFSWIVIDDDRVRLKDFEPFDEFRFMSNVTALRELANKAGYMMPTVNKAAEDLGITQKEMNRIIVYLKERKELTIIGDGFIVFADLEADFKNKLACIDGDITLAGVRDMTGSSRKYVLPLLEYFDSRGITRRIEDKRIFLKKQR